jgi:hypothetical protein
MIDKPDLLGMLRDEFDRWEGLLNQRSTEQLTTPELPAGLSLKDVVAHLAAWQERSIAKLEAGLKGGKPRYPGWPEELDPESEEDLEKVNAWIHEKNLDRSWEEVHRAWQQGFRRLLELGEAIPEKDLFDRERYQWLDGYTLADVMLGSYEHHHVEHLEPMRAWLSDHDIRGDFSEPPPGPGR